MDVLSDDGEITSRMRFAQVRGAGDFVVDSRRSLVYFYIPDSTELLRVPLDAAG